MRGTHLAGHGDSTPPQCTRREPGAERRVLGAQGKRARSGEAGREGAGTGECECKERCDGRKAHGTDEAGDQKPAIKNPRTKSTFEEGGTGVDF